MMARDYKSDGVISNSYGTDAGRVCKAELLEFVKMKN